jgi:hypothetical protein
MSAGRWRCAGTPTFGRSPLARDRHTSQDTDVASDLLYSLVEESEPRCGVLLSTGYFDSAVVLADEVWELSRGKLTRASGPRDEDEDHDEDPDDVIVHFPTAEKRGSRGTGYA